MKRKITKSQYEDLPEEIQKQYKEVDGNFVLQIEDVDVDDLLSRVDSMDSKIQELLGEKKSEKRKREEAEEEARVAKAKKDGDIEALEASWQEKMDKALEAKDTQIAGLQSGIVGLTTGATAEAMAAELALPGSSSVLKPHITARLKTEFGDDGTTRTVVLDKEGKPSAMTIDELKAEISSMQEFGPILVGSKASGAGHHDKGGSGGPNKGNFGGSREERTAAIKSKFPDLES